jgi:hypothetical protein
MKSAKVLAIVGGMSLLLAEAGSAMAAAPTLRVRCEVRSNRSKISVDLKRAVNGSVVTAVVTNTGGLSVAAIAAQTVVRKQAEFDFDSDDDEIGATVIDAGFIVGSPPQITATILELPGLSKTVACKVKK